MGNRPPRAVVTGAANGIGRAVAQELASCGVRVIGLDREPGDGSVELIATDLSRSDEVDSACAVALQRLDDGLEVLVNCAGIASTSSLRGFEADAYRLTMAVNLDAAVRVMAACVPAMISAGYGRIVNISSIHSSHSERGALAYDISKAGLEAATRSAALELADQGVLVNAVAPGFVNTRLALVNGVNELDVGGSKTVYIDHGRLPLRRGAEPAEIAKAVAFLSSADNTYITGQVIVVDGGLTAGF